MEVSAFLARLPHRAEARYPEAYDTFRRSVTEIVDVADGTVDLLFRFLCQNTGVLPKRGREKNLPN